MKDSTTDRELLELAAKATGKENGSYCELSGDVPALYFPGEGVWDPLTGDGDCARMEAAVGIDIEWHPLGVVARVLRAAPLHDVVARETYHDHGGDRNAARRLASTKAAAEIGRSHHAG